MYIYICIFYIYIYVNRYMWLITWYDLQSHIHSDIPTSSYAHMHVRAHPHTHASMQPITHYHFPTLSLCAVCMPHSYREKKIANPHKIWETGTLHKPSGEEIWNSASRVRSAIDWQFSIFRWSLAVSWSRCLFVCVCVCVYVCMCVCVCVFVHARA